MEFCIDFGLKSLVRHRSSLKAIIDAHRYITFSVHELIWRLRQKKEAQTGLHESVLPCTPLPGERRPQADVA